MSYLDATTMHADTILVYLNFCRGFNDWSRFQCNISEQLFVDTADAMVNNGMLKAGYNREYGFVSDE